MAKTREMEFENAVKKITSEFGMCECSIDYVYSLTTKTVEERVCGTSNVGMQQIVAIVPKFGNVESLGSEGREIVEWCADFLHFITFEEKEKTTFPKENQNQYRTNKSINIFTFIKHFLGIESSYAHWLMNFLERVGIMDHGFFMENGFFNGERDSRIVSKERQEQIIEWASNAPDTIR